MIESQPIVWVDVVIIAVILISAIISLFRGFVREAFSLAVWILAFWLSWSFFRELAIRMETLITTPSVRLGVAFAVILLLALAVGGLINYLVIRLIQSTGLSGSDRFIGMIFGVARGILFITALVWLAGLTPFPLDPWWQESRLLPFFGELALWLRDMLPADIVDSFRFIEIEPLREKV